MVYNNTTIQLHGSATLTNFFTPMWMKIIFDYNSNDKSQSF